MVIHLRGAKLISPPGSITININESQHTMTENRILQKNFCTHDNEWPDEIELHFSRETLNYIDYYQRHIAIWSGVTSIRMHVPDDLICEPAEHQLEVGGEFDIARLVIYRDDVALFIQSKWDSRIQAEYS